MFEAIVEAFFALLYLIGAILVMLLMTVFFIATLAQLFS